MFSKSHFASHIGSIVFTELQTLNTAAQLMTGVMVERMCRKMLCTFVCEHWLRAPESSGNSELKNNH